MSAAQPSSSSPASGAPGFDVRDAAIVETYVVPTYLSLFAEPMLEAIIGMRDARVCHAQCRTGYPDAALLAKLPNVHLYGCDESDPALAVARAKAMGIPGFTADFRRHSGAVLPFPDGAFSHAFTLHPNVRGDARATLFSELARIIAPRGQVLVGLPLHGSFGELSDLLREAALRLERPALSEAADLDAAERPTVTELTSALSSAGLDHVDVEPRARVLRFESGRDLFESPVLRLMILPVVRANLASRVSEEEVTSAFVYVRDAVDKYWSDGGFELTVNVGIASGRRPG